MPLPTQKKTPSDTLADYTILIAGEKNSGKTGFAAQFPNHFIFEFEPGNAKHLNCVYEDIPNLKTFDYWLQKAEKDPEPRTIVIDEVQRLYNLIMERLLDQEGVDDPKDLGWGKGWKRINAQFDKYITRLQALPGGNIYTAHCEYKEMELRSGKKITKLVPKFGAETNRFKDKWIHICGQIMFTDGGQRIFYLQGDELIEASCKLLDNHFRFNGRSLNKFPMGANATEAYNNFTIAFANELEVPEEFYVPLTNNSPSVANPRIKAAANKIGDNLKEKKKTGFSFG